VSRRLQSVFSAAVTLLIFTVLPLYAPSQLPPELDALISRAGFDLTDLINKIAVIGVALTLLTLVKGFAEKHSPLYLLASIASSTLTLAFTLITLGLGDWENLGVTKVSMGVQGATNTVVLDLSVFVKLAAVTVALEVIHSILEFIDARKQRSEEQRLPERLVADTELQPEDQMPPEIRPLFSVRD
jgi:hypothetical protein